jgi:hypothetical protein
LPIEMLKKLNVNWCKYFWGEIYGWKNLYNLWEKV